MPGKGRKGMGASNRRFPTGGSTYGTPSHSSRFEVALDKPRNVPRLVLISNAELEAATPHFANRANERYCQKDRVIVRCELGPGNKTWAARRGFRIYIRPHWKFEWICMEPVYSCEKSLGKMFTIVLDLFRKMWKNVLRLLYLSIDSVRKCGFHHVIVAGISSRQMIARLGAWEKTREYLLFRRTEISIRITLDCDTNPKD